MKKNIILDTDAINRIKQIIILSLLFFSGLNLFAKSFYMIFIAFIVLLVFNIKKLILDRTTILLLAFSTVYVVFSNNYNTLNDLLKIFSFPMCYFMGLNFLNNNTEKLEYNKNLDYQIKFAFFIPALGSFTHYIFNYFTNIGNLNRNTTDIWTGESMSATGQATLAILAVAAFLSVVFSINIKSKPIKWLCAAGLFLILVYNMILSGRTLIFIFIIEFIVAFIYYMVCNSSNIKRFRLLIFLAIAVVAFLVAYSIDLFKIRTMILGSNLSQRFEINSLFSDTRVLYKYKYIKLMIAYPFGGGKIFNKIGTYAHELYLDIYNDAGIFAYLLIIAFIIITLYKSIKFIKNKSINPDTRLLVGLMNIVFFMIFLVEPIMVGMPWLLCAYCFYQGVIGLNVTATKHPETLL